MGGCTVQQQQQKTVIELVALQHFFTMSYFQFNMSTISMFVLLSCHPTDWLWGLNQTALDLAFSLAFLSFTLLRHKAIDQMEHSRFILEGTFYWPQCYQPWLKDGFIHCWEVTECFFDKFGTIPNFMVDDGDDDDDVVCLKLL